MDERKISVLTKTDFGGTTPHHCANGMMFFVFRFSRTLQGEQSKSCLVVGGTCACVLLYLWNVRVFGCVVAQREWEEWRLCLSILAMVEEYHIIVHMKIHSSENIYKPSYHTHAYYGYMWVFYLSSNMAHFGNNSSYCVVRTRALSGNRPLLW